jgi:hypothetical protein
MVSRRTFLLSSSAFAALPVISRLVPIPTVYAGDPPAAIPNAKAQFYNFLRSMVTGAITTDQNIVLNSTIFPFDIADDTPFYNDEIFRAYADRTFSGGVEGLQANAQAFFAARFSSQYRAVMNIVTAQIDRKHPQIANSLKELKAQLRTSNESLAKKINELDMQWQTIATARALTPDTMEYNTQFAAWAALIHYTDQLRIYSDEVEQIISAIDATRRGVYTPTEIAALDNQAFMGSEYNVNRPWTANIERSYERNGSALSDLILANPRNLVPAMFDSSPLVLPIGDLRKFLKDRGERSFDTLSTSFQLDESSRRWNASGGGSFLFWSAGGGASSSSSMSNSVSKMSSLSVSFQNLSEYLAERAQWFNPGVLQDPKLQTLVESRPEVKNLQYIAVSLIIARGTKLELRFSEAVNTSDWNESSWNAGGGVSFLGFSFGARGGSSSTNYRVTRNANNTTVTIQDGDQVTRVLGVRVERFLSPPAGGVPHLETLDLDSGAMLAPGLASVQSQVKLLKEGKLSYMEFQKNRLATLPKLQLEPGKKQKNRPRRK